jgi:hypothetical protein
MVGCRPRTTLENAGEKWHVVESRSPMDDTKTYALTLDAKEAVESIQSIRARPSLVIRCQQGKTDVYVVTHVLPKPHFEIEGAYEVRLRVDQEEAEEMFWKLGQDRVTLFAPVEVVKGGGVGERHAFTVEFTKRLAAAQTLFFEFTPELGNPVVVQFDVRGLGKYIDKLRQECQWQ